MNLTEVKKSLERQFDHELHRRRIALYQQIELDLDDGVKVNYENFQGVDVPKDNGKIPPPYW